MRAEFAPRIIPLEVIARALALGILQFRVALDTGAQRCLRKNRAQKSTEHPLRRPGAAHSSRTMHGLLLVFRKHHRTNRVDDAVVGLDVGLRDRGIANADDVALRAYAEAVPLHGLDRLLPGHVAR